MRNMRSARYALNKNKYLLPNELESLEQLLGRQLDREPRNCLILLLALKTGARAQEVLNLRKSNLNQYENSIFIQGIKGSNDREIPLHAALFRKLVNYVESMPIRQSGKVIDDRLFPITYNRLRQIWELYRPVPKKLHSLRHTFAIQLYKKTKDIRLVQVALGHRNVMNTMIYADYVYSQSELRKLIL